MPRRYNNNDTSSFARYKTAKAASKLKGRSSRAALLSVCANPFSTRTIHAKIPDGKTHLSSGQRLQRVAALPPAPIQPTGLMEILFFPGINNCISILQQQNANPNLAVNAHIGSTHARINANGDQVDDSLTICSWRTVSAGLRLSLVNNADANEGWFQACRINLCAGDGFQIDANGDDSFVTGIANINQMAQTEGFNAQNLALSPSFVSGKLRDIHKYTFKLKTNTDDHAFTNLLATGNDPSNLIDLSQDAILIRIHGNATSRLMIHYVHNQELIYDEDTALYRASTRSFHDPQLTNMIMSMNTTASPLAGVMTAALYPKRKKRKYRYARYAPY